LLLFEPLESSGNASTIGLIHVTEELLIAEPSTFSEPDTQDLLVAVAKKRCRVNL
jgi:hypothetical protein